MMIHHIIYEQKIKLKVATQIFITWQKTILELIELYFSAIKRILQIVICVNFKN